ncbi:MAG: prepilin-type N-terminal cleavage/methylation domain-containing protein [Candidatus Omnitrophica bacterium]|nr:prepilin-type N-terminal cleavage/methylation domain-containing protein [Candidatus Omnitrophota bacterium]
MFYNNRLRKDKRTKTSLAGFTRLEIAVCRKRTKVSLTGFTLVEILVSVLILSFLLAALFMVLNVGSMTQSSDLGLLDLQQQARRAMDAMTRELRQTKSSEMSFISSSEITFSIPSQTYGAAWVGPIRYYLYSVNSRIMREYPAGTEKIVAGDITSLTFTPSSNILDIELTCAKTVRQRDLSFFLKGRVRLRNE